ncbi:hypothetical protein B0H17DRAFT_1179481 [Mycena rosella]|uniref:F-box domain-containing protein n=1 Tax=Mycena rosella TaxID=1033263 RepID=A0AAD7GJ95_MYCRO|nr:hypothetical protein B0H17DRAFT_1179481 [Mycena rosella]
MSTVRRQSGRLAQQAISPAKTKEFKVQVRQGKPQTGTDGKITEPPEPLDDSYEESEEDEIESDASEYGKKRPAKRQKLNNSKSRTLGKRKVANETCYLTTIPLDVLLEIFVQLEPKDLILLARTNRAFREHLLSKTANITWKNARENMDGPDCPPDLSEQRWAQLLYGAAKCQSCGAKNIQRVDFGLRRRACTRCLKNNLVVTSSFSKHFPHLEDTILKLIPYTNIGGFAHGHASSSNFYWKADIEKVAETLAVKEHDVHMHLIGARKKLEDFTAERVALVATVVEHAALCRDWSKQLVIRREHEAIRLCDQRHNAIKDRFMKLGYAEADLSSLTYRPSVRQTTQLTDRIWNKIYPELETVVKERRDRRLKAERDARIEARTELVQSIYTEFKKSLVPAQWCFLPGLHEVLRLPAFDTVVNAPDDVDVEMSHFKKGRDALPGFVVSWPATRKAELVRLMDEARASTPNSSDIQAATTSTVAVSDTQSLDLATTVFVCTRPSCGTGYAQPTSPNVLTGWEGAAGHHCRQSDHFSRRVASVETNFALSKRGSTAAAFLVTLAGLDTKQATCAEMDRLDLRFVCIACPPRAAPGKKQAYQVFTWRTAVSHFGASNHSAPQWRRLNSIEIQQIKANEAPDPTLSWSCNHCPQFLDDYHTFASVADHVKTVHAIANPTAPADLFRFLDLPRTPATFLGPALQYHCKRCPRPNKNNVRRIFQLDGVQSHLQAKQSFESSGQ